MGISTGNAILALISLLLLGCPNNEDDDRFPADTGTVPGDSGARDAAPMDAGPIDAEPIDADPVDADPIDADPVDADPIDADPVDADPIDADAPDAIVDAGCMPTGAEICDDLDNDCNDLIDDVDVGGDGIYDCLTIALFGNAGPNGSSNFLAWLQSNGASVQRLQTATTPSISPSLLEGFDVIILDDLIRPYTAAEATTMRQWVEGGGGLISMTGHSFNANWANNNSVMAELGVEYVQTFATNPVTMWLPHPTSDGLTSVTFNGGHRVQAVAGASFGASTVTASTSANLPVAIAHEQGMGRAFVWGDEWVSYDSEWQALPDVPRFWANVLGWVARFR